MSATRASLASVPPAMRHPEGTLADLYPRHASRFLPSNNVRQSDGDIADCGLRIADSIRIVTDWAGNWLTTTAAARPTRPREVRNVMGRLSAENIAFERYLRRPCGTVGWRSLASRSRFIPPGRRWFR